jgi:hypothetical protein
LQEDYDATLLQARSYTYLIVPVGFSQPLWVQNSEAGWVMEKICQRAGHVLALGEGGNTNILTRRMLVRRRFGRRKKNRQGWKTKVTSLSRNGKDAGGCGQAFQ